MEDVKPEEIQNLLQYFARKTFRAKDSDAVTQNVMQRCIDLVSLDYSHILIDNAGGELSAHYPSQLIVMEYEKVAKEDCNCSGGSPPKSTNNGTLYESVYDVSKLKDLFMKARSARCRARFPLPVILYNGKNICRSSTLSGGPEMYGRQGYEYFFCCEETGPEEQDEQRDPQTSPGDWQLFDKVRSLDIRLLKTLNVGAIIDFMVEKKKVKFGLNVSSSEKVDKENRYSEFTIISLPYPGCEFFKAYRDNDYVAQGLVFDWSQGHVDAAIGIPNDTISSKLKIDWENYKMWDLITLTQNYMRLVLRYLVDQPLGLLIHCISGWDRTPLFVSLLRLSLWADGAIHQSLTAAQILYFTIAYDWMLFGHNLYDRLSKGEEIFFFCFHFLKYMVGEEYSVSRWSNKLKNGSVLRTDSDLQLEGLLLDADAPISSQGSNISLNSSWSSISSKSHDTPPVFFPTDEYSGSNSNASIVSNMSCCENSKMDSPNCSSTSTDPSVHSLPHTNHSSSNGSLDNGFESPMSSGSDQKSSNSNQEPRTFSSFSRNLSNRTSPVAVPTRASIRTRNESTSSLSTGSWQFVTGTGSFRGSGSNSTCSCHLSSNHSRSTLNDNASLQDSTTTIIEDDCFIYNNSPDIALQRRERLTSVRNLFYNCYCSTVGFKLKDGSETSSLGLLLGNFAEKVGFISTQRTSV